MTKSEMFSRAHAQTRKLRDTYKSADYRVTFAAALRNLYEEETYTAAEIWTAYSDEQKMAALKGATGYEYRLRDARYIIRNGKMVMLDNVFSWVTDTAELEQVANDAYIYLVNFFDTKPEWPLGLMLSHAARRAAQFISRQERRNPSALKRDSKTGEEYIDASSEPTAEPIAPSPETAAIIADGIERAAADETDSDIITMLKMGFSGRDIAEYVGMSHTAVNKRIKRIRERYAAVSGEALPPERVQPAESRDKFRYSAPYLMK